ncbi:MAG: hypothetical protein ACRELA_10965 [Candidatus Rokuibacteriota bacterium]
MDSIKPVSALLMSALLVAGLAPTAVSDHCGPIIIFGRVTQQAGQNAGVNAGGVGCTAAGENSPSVKEITPLSPNLQVRFIGSFPGVTTLSGSIAGLGLSQAITLTRVGSAYDGALLPIDPLATGTVTATVATPTGTFTSTFTKSA